MSPSLTVIDGPILLDFSLCKFTWHSRCADLEVTFSLVRMCISLHLLIGGGGVAQLLK